MFPLFDQDLPLIEQKIISYLGPVDIVRCRKVCIKWAKLMQGRIIHLKRTMTNDPRIAYKCDVHNGPQTADKVTKVAGISVLVS